MTPLAYSWQLPEPLHKPFFWQLVAPSSVQSFCGSVPAPMLPQVPLTPLPLSAAVHAMHSPAHAVSQHTPSTQLPLTHCDAVVQATPFDRSGWQVPSEIRHQLVATHCASLVHADAHAVALAHVKGAHVTAVPALHVPSPSQA